MSKVTICIHGRSNKPDANTLRKWWKNSIIEGLEKNCEEDLRALDVEMAYYADIYYPTPVPNADNDEPYKKSEKGAIRRYKKGFMDRLRGKTGDWLDNPLDWLEEHSDVFSSLAKQVTKNVLKDLGVYYNKIEERNKVKQRLRELLLERKEDEIILISHSMGTIVAYEVLRELGRDQDTKGIEVEHFITMGAPLGLTAVKGNIVQGDLKKLRTPTCVSKTWLNFSDPQDRVCLDSHLADDYEKNSSGVHVKDVMVCNDYPGNEHKSYGYLRTPEFSDHFSLIT